LLSRRNALGARDRATDGRREERRHDAAGAVPRPRASRALRPPAANRLKIPKREITPATGRRARESARRRREAQRALLAEGTAGSSNGGLSESRVSGRIRLARIDAEDLLADQEQIARRERNGSLDLRERSVRRAEVL